MHLCLTLKKNPVKVREKTCSCVICISPSKIQVKIIYVPLSYFYLENVPVKKGGNLKKKKNMVLNSKFVFQTKFTRYSHRF